MPQYQHDTGTTAVRAEKPPGRLPFRLFLIFFLPTALLILGGAWHIGKDRIESELGLIRAAEISNVVMGVRRLDGGLEVPNRHLRALAGDETARQAIDGGGTGPLERTFLNLATFNPLYDQVRWIDETGMERLRVNNTHGRVVVVAPGQLQDKADRYYFAEAMRLGPGEVYVSPLDLNVEGTAVEVPHRPMLRLATPVQDRHGKPRGILILNVAAQHLLDGFTESLMDARDHVMLVNRDGYWLRSPDPEDAWGFMFGRGETLGDRHPEAWQALTAIPSGQVELADGMWTWSTVYPLKAEDNGAAGNDPHWLVIAHLPANQLALVRDQAWRSVGGAALVLLLVFGALSAFLASAVAGRNRARVEAARAHAEAEAANRLREAQERFRLVVEANPNGLLVVDTEGRIVLTNPALERMFGYEPQELLGQQLDSLLPEAARERHGEHLAAYLHSPSARPMGMGRDLHGRRKDGSEFPVEISLSPFTENGRLYVDALVADISERKRLERLAGSAPDRA